MSPNRLVEFFDTRLGEANSRSGDVKRKKEINRNTGQRLRRIREHRGVSQYWLAEAVGVSRTTIEAYECAKSDIPAGMVIKLAAALDCDPADLFDPADSDPPPFKSAGGRADSYQSTNLMKAVSNELQKMKQAILANYLSSYTRLIAAYYQFFLSR